jgi:membrane protease YdiL (CAAX protease family)
LTARRVFVAADGRLRAGWRILLFFIAFVIFARLTAMTIRSVYPFLNAITGVDGTGPVCTATIALLLAHYVMLRWIDKRTWSYVWLDKAAARPALLVEGGVPLGALPILIPSLVLVGVGWLAVQPAADGPWWRTAAQLTLFFMLAAIPEELLSRGYLFAALRDGLGWTGALLVTSLGFGLLHLPNPGSDAASITAVTLSGVFLGAIVIITRSLYAAWMAHWAWNWVMAALLHTPVSGLPVPSPDYRVVDAGPDWATGGVWGPEGGIPANVGVLVALAYLYWRRSAMYAVSSERTAQSAQLTAPSDDKPQG